MNNLQAREFDNPLPQSFPHPHTHTHRLDGIYLHFTMKFDVLCNIAEQSGMQNKRPTGASNRVLCGWMRARSFLCVHQHEYDVCCVCVCTLPDLNLD